MAITATELTMIGYSGSLAELVLDYHQRAHTSEFVSTCPEKMCQTAQEVAGIEMLLGMGG